MSSTALWTTAFTAAPTVPSRRRQNIMQIVGVLGAGDNNAIGGARYLHVLALVVVAIFALSRLRPLRLRFSFLSHDSSRCKFFYDY